MGAAKLLSRLDKVKRTGAGRWLASCPAHDDKRPSLSIRELDDGRVLIHCFSQQCDVHSVLSAVGLEMADLFPEREIHHGKPERRPFPAVDVLKAISFEVLVVSLAASRMAAGKPFSATDRERVFLAANRIDAALAAAGVSHG